LRSSTPKPSPASPWTPRKPPLSKNVLAENDWIDDFEYITHAELPLQLDSHSSPSQSAAAFTTEAASTDPGLFEPSSPASSPDPISCATPSNSFSTNAHSVPTRSTHLTSHNWSSRRQNSEPKGDSDSQQFGLSDLTLDFPQPPTYIPTPFLTPQLVQKDKPDAEQKINNTLPDTYSHQPQIGYSQIKHNLPFHRLKSLTKVLTIYSNVTSAIGKSPSFLARFTKVKHPEQATSNSKAAASPKPSGQVEVTPPSPVEQIPLRTKYERVDPSKLTDSPSLLNFELLSSSARTSFVPPSPSWLSRNVQNFNPSELPDNIRKALHLDNTTKPSALPQLFTSLSTSSSIRLSPLEVAEDWQPSAGLIYLH
jgi:hypothetical protein